MNLRVFALLLIPFVPIAAQIGVPGNDDAAPRPRPVTVNTRIMTKTPTRLEVALDLKAPQGLVLYSTGDQFFEIKSGTLTGLKLKAIQRPATTPYKDEISGKTVPVYAGTSRFRLVYRFTGDPGSVWQLGGYVQFQGCTDTLCYAPQKKPFRLSGTVPEANAAKQTAAPSRSVKRSSRTDASTQTAPDSRDDLYPKLDRFTVTGRSFGFQKPADFLDFLRAGASSSEQTNADRSLWGGGGWKLLLLIGAILLGGLGLNLTPCVLPMIPINLAVIGAGARDRSKRRGFLLGSLYGAAMALTYGALGVAVVLTGSTFGAFHASPVFNFIIAGVFVLLALAMFGVFNIDLSRFRQGRLTGKLKGHTYVLAFVMGAVAALLAGACVAPALIAVLVQAAALYAAGNPAGLALPFILGLGMAIPWPLIGGGIASIPKPGKWMDYVKYGFGVIILALALYYGYTGMKHTGVFDRGEAYSVSAQFGSLTSALDASLADGRPVFIDFWATWCKNCTAMEATTFRDPAVRRQLEATHVVKFQAENTDRPEIQRLLKRFDVPGLPTYILLTPANGK